MIKVSVMYPYSEGKGFDMEYYCEEHVPMVRQKLGSAYKGYAVEQGIAGGTPGAPPTYVAMGHIYFESIEAFQTAFWPHVPALQADTPNYTTIEPIIQISEVKI